MFEVSKDFFFEAGHCLPFHDGLCARFHGHSYRVVVHVRGDLQEKGPKQGMVLDYAEISAAAQPVIDALDHTCLNEIAGLGSQGRVPARFFLSTRAALGILERASRRGRSLPPGLEEQLRAVAGLGPEEPLPGRARPRGEAPGPTPPTEQQATLFPKPPAP